MTYIPDLRQARREAAMKRRPKKKGHRNKKESKRGGFEAATKVRSFAINYLAPLESRAAHMLQYLSNIDLATAIAKYEKQSSQEWTNETAWKFLKEFRLRGEHEASKRGIASLRRSPVLRRQRKQRDVPLPQAESKRWITGPLTVELIQSAEFYQTREWRILRYKALVQNGRKCQCCGRTPPDIVLHVDHIKPKFHHPELALELSNLQILCEDCNLGKGAWDQTDFRVLIGGLK